MKKFISFLTLALVFFAFPAAADVSRQVECTTFLSLASTNDNTPMAIAPRGGAKLLRVRCYTDVDATTPAQISFEDGAANDVTHATLTCSENGTTADWIPATAGNSFVSGEPIVFDVDNSSDTQPYVVCVELQRVKQ